MWNLILCFLRKLTFTVALFCASTIASAQQQKIDSLLSLLESSKPDTVRINILAQLSREMYRSGRYDDEVKFATEGLGIAITLKYGKGQGDAWSTIGHVAMRKGEYDSALRCFKRAMANFEAIRDFRKLANVHLFTGQVNDYLAKYAIALDQYRQALTLIQSYPDDFIEFKILNSTGVTYFNKGSYETALEYYIKALAVSEKFEDKLYYASVLNNIGVVHMSILQYDDALQYFLKYLKSMRAMGHKQFVAVALLNVGEAFMNKQQYKRAVNYLDSALVAYERVAEKRGLSLTHSNLGDCYAMMNDFEAAEIHYADAIAIAEVIRSEEALLKGLLGAAGLYIKNGDNTKAGQYLDRARPMARRTGSMLLLEKAYLFSAKLDSAQTNYAGAYHWYKAYSNLNDSLFSERKSQQVLQMRERYESEKKDKEILLLNEANKREELKASSNQRLFVISIIFSAIIITAILFWLYVKSSHSQVLREQNEKINDAYKELKNLMDRVEMQNKVLAEKNDALEELHREKDGIIGIVAHDLRAPLNRISGLLRLLTYGRDLTAADKEIVAVIEKVCHDGNGLIRDLLDINQYETTQSLDLTTVELATHIEALLSHYTASLEKKNLKLSYQHEGRTTASTSVSYLNRILDNVITNAIKFSPANKEISVKLSGHQEYVHVVIEDQGQGFHPDDLPHLFRKFKKLSARPTGGEASTGLGLSIVKTLVEKIGGDVKIESEWGRGARVTIVLPVEIVGQHAVLA